MNLIRRLKLNHAFQDFDEYTSKEFPELPLALFNYDRQYLDSSKKMDECLSKKNFDGAEKELNTVKKPILEHCQLNGYLIKTMFVNDLPNKVVALCVRTGLLNFEIRMRRLSLSSYSYIALMIHEIAYVYQIAKGKPLFDEKNLKTSEKYTDYLTLLLGFYDQISTGYLLAFSDDIPMKLNYLDFDDINYAIKRNVHIPH